MNIKEFEHTIQLAIYQIPPKLRNKISNVAFVIEDDTRAAKRTERAIRSQGTLLGLYQGVPLPSRSGYYSGVLPDKITLFKQAIERTADYDQDKIKRLITQVVHHEVGHYFGMSERHVRTWEKNRTNKT